MSHEATSKTWEVSLPETDTENQTFTKGAYRTFFVLFMLSGFAGLLYQVVWLRLAFSSFGVITPVISVVLSVFMAGLFIGSLLSGRLSTWLESRDSRWGALFYALAEITIGAGALAVPTIFRFFEGKLLGWESTHSAGFLFFSALSIAISLLPWCIAMGTTTPLMMQFLRSQYRDTQKSFSFLYFANVLGAMLGVAVTALVLIEWLGFTQSLLVGASLNLSVAIAALVLANSSRKNSPIETQTTDTGRPTHRSSHELPILFLTGFLAMGMEVVWTRAFTPVLKTQVYSFAMLLFTYLFATTVGSAWYRRDLKRGRVLSTTHLLLLSAICALFPVLLNDPRVLPNLLLKVVAALGSVVPLSLLLGYLSPKQVDEYSNGNPSRAGYAYSINVLGCILGPLVGSYLLLPFLGVRLCLVVFAIPLLVAALWKETPIGIQRWRYATITVLLLVLCTVAIRSYEEHFLTYGDSVEIRRDSTATVISMGEGENKALFVNGNNVTTRTVVTKFMAHLPLLLTPQVPEKALTICFGMGTTFRSLTRWGIDTTAVELVPSVAEAFGFYFEDATSVLKQPNVRIVVDDGRRYLSRKSDQYDVITIDPPPPVEAAASSLLYSVEFYELAKSRLVPGGILAQWFPGGETQILGSVHQALKQSFPYVKAFAGVENWGIHFLASDSPIEIPTLSAALERMPKLAKLDMTEWNPTETSASFLAKMFEREMDLSKIPLEALPISDSRPINEYFLVRRLSSQPKGLSFFQKLFPSSWNIYWPQG